MCVHLDKHRLEEVQHGRQTLFPSKPIHLIYHIPGKSIITINTLPISSFQGVYGSSVTCLPHPNVYLNICKQLYQSLKEENYSWYKQTQFFTATVQYLKTGRWKSA